MELNRRDFLKIVGLVSGAAALSGCRPVRDLIDTTSAPLPTDIPQPTLAPTSEQREILPEITPTKTTEQRFQLGSFDTYRENFAVRFSDELNSQMGYIQASNIDMTADIQLPVVVQGFGTYEQFQTFEKAAYFNFEGNPYYVILSDQENHLFFYFHSITTGAVGEVPRKITSYLLQQERKNDRIEDESLREQKNQEVLNSVLGQKLTINIETGQAYEAEVVNISIIGHEFFEDLGDGGPWDTQTVFTAKTESFGIREAVRNDKTPGVYYLSFVSCQSTDGKVSPWLSVNVEKRAVVTLRVVIP